MTSSPSDDSMLLNELRIKDETLTKEMYENASDPANMLHILIKKLQLYNEMESSLSEDRNKIVVGLMKIVVENRIIITRIKRDMDEQIVHIINRVEALEFRIGREEITGRKSNPK